MPSFGNKVVLLKKRSGVPPLTISSLPHQQVPSRHVWGQLSDHSKMLPLNQELAPGKKTGLYYPQTGVKLMAPPKLWYSLQTGALLMTALHLLHQNHPHPMTPPQTGGPVHLPLVLSLTLPPPCHYHYHLLQAGESMVMIYYMTLSST